MRGAEGSIYPVAASGLCEESESGMNRRTFLSVLASVPFLGKLAPVAPTVTAEVITRADTMAGWGALHDPWIPMTVTPSEGGGSIYITNRGSFYEIEVKDDVPYRITHAHLTRLK